MSWLTDADWAIIRAAKGITEEEHQAKIARLNYRANLKCIACGDRAISYGHLGHIDRPRKDGRPRIVRCKKCSLEAASKKRMEKKKRVN